VNANQSNMPVAPALYYSSCEFGGWPR